MNKQIMIKHYEATTKETLIDILVASREEVEKLQNRNKECKQEIERLNKEKENLTNIVANKIIKDYDIKTPLKDELNKERTRNVVLSSENNMLNNIINELEKWLEEDLKQVYRDAGHRHNLILEVLDKLQELKGSE